MFNEMLAFSLVVFTSFFTLMNPIGIMPVFLKMTENLDDKERISTARKAVFTSFLALMFFAFSGNFLFDFFGISIHGLRMVGGIVFFVMGQDMLNARLASSKVRKEDVKAFVRDISITPLAIPMITGPGSITNAIILMNDADSIELKITFVITIVALMLLILIILSSAGKLVKLLGETGNLVLMRIMGLIVMVIAIEFFIAGLKPVIQDIWNIQ